MKIKIENGVYGKKAIIQSSWKSEFLKYLVDNKIAELELNDGLGWKGENLDFLIGLKWLKSIKIIDLTINDISPIHCLVELEFIEIITYCKTPIDFNRFLNLKHCSLEWRSKSFSLFERKELKTLFINNFKSKESKYFAQLSDLEELSIHNSSIEEIYSVFSLPKLKKLRLANLRKLNDLSGINKLSRLIELEIEKCIRLDSVQEIFELKKLRRLLIVDLKNINTFNGIDALKELDTLLFYGSTNILDGDLSPILKLESIKNLSFQNRKHYSNNREDFQANLSS